MSVQITTSEGNELNLHFYGDPEVEKPVIVYVHGFQGVPGLGIRSLHI